MVNPPAQRPGSPRRGRLLTRRTLLSDLGRVTLGAVVVGTLGACGDGSSEPEGGQAASSGGRTEVGGLTFERATFGFVSAYVLVLDGEALVFDTGTGDDAVEPITTALGAAGVGWTDVSHVLVSHDHGDHIGGIEAVMAEATAATAYAAGPDFATLQRRVADASEVGDGDQLLGLRVVATPGHTLGHVAAFEPGAGVLLAGDAIVNGVQIGGTSGDGVEVSPPDFTADRTAAAASAAILADLEPSTVLFGHGEPIVGGAAEQLAHLGSG